MTPRALAKVAKRYGLCSRNGRDFLFSERDLLAIWQTIREPAKSPKPAPLKPSLSDYQTRKSLQRLSRPKSKKVQAEREERANRIRQSVRASAAKANK
jgi:hypothetical protein